MQDRLAGNSNGKTSHKKVNEDFPLRGYVKCVGCGRNLTAAWSRGKGGQRFAYYFCWNKQCKGKVTAPREQVEFKYFSLLCMHEASAATLAQLPAIAARMWAQRQETIAIDARLLTRQLEDQKSLNTKLITAKLKGEITQSDFEHMKTSIEAETQKIESEMRALDAEKSKMQELIKQREEEPVNFGFAWRDAPFSRKIEMQKVFYPEGLVYSLERGFFEPQNEYLFQQLANLFGEMLNLASPTGFEPVLSP